MKEYRTEAWQFCHNLENEVLKVDFELDKKIFQDLKKNSNTDEFCENNDDGVTVSSVCSNDDGHLTCLGDVMDILCELRGFTFKSITFSFKKDTDRVNVENYFEAETNAYFRQGFVKGEEFFWSFCEFFLRISFCQTKSLH